MPLKMNCKIELISNQALEKGLPFLASYALHQRNIPTEGTIYWKVCLNRWFHLLLKRCWREGERWEPLFTPSIGLLRPLVQSRTGHRVYAPPLVSCWHPISLCSSGGGPR